MPAVIDRPEVVAYKAHDLQEEQAQVPAAHPGFWQRVQQYVQRQSVQTSIGMPSSSQRTLHPMETPAELLLVPIRRSTFEYFEVSQCMTPIQPEGSHAAGVAVVCVPPPLSAPQSLALLLPSMKTISFAFAIS
jgi:hypothetical protein